MKSHPSYESVGVVGQSRRATVYRARDLALNREVAIKELNDEARGDRELWQRFWEEARFLANVEHDNVVQIYGLDQERGWIIMELADASLAGLLASGPLVADQVRSVLRQVFDGLDCFHQRGRTHGAIKPGNLLLSHQNIVKLSDTTGVSGGPVRDAPAKYVAPEQLNSAYGPVGPGVDLYCLGFTALELLAGPDFDALFPGVEAGAEGWHQLHGSPEPLPGTAALIPGIPPDLARVIDRLVQKRVANRYASAADALKDLGDAPAIALESDPRLRTIAPGASKPVVFASPPTVRTPHGGATQSEPVGRETLLPTMFPVLNSPNELAAALLPVAEPEAARAAPALETVRDTPTYPPWSRRWINQKLENPGVLYPLCGVIGFVTMLLLANLVLNRSVSPPLPPPPSPPVVEVRPAITVTSTPTGASIIIDGKPIAEKTNASVYLTPGSHKVQVELPGFALASQSVTVSREESENKPVEFLLQALRTDPVSTARAPPATSAPVFAPQTGKLRVRSHPENAKVIVDGSDKGRTPLEIDVAAGTHTVRLEHAKYKSLQQEVVVQPGSPTVVDQSLDPLRAPGSFALLIGVHQVAGLPVFRHAPGDMTELGRTLLAAGYYRSNVVVLAQSINGNPATQPTGQRIRESIKSFLMDRYPGDTLLLALAGPTLVRTGETTSYFCPADGDVSKPATLIALPELFEQLAACPARTRIVLFDGNRAGPSFPPRPPAAKAEDLATPGVTLFAASSDGEPGYVHADLRHSVFWYYVLRGLRGAAGGGRAITVGALARYVREETKQYTDKNYKMEQTPKLFETSQRVLSATLAEPEPVLGLLLEGEVSYDKKEYEKAIEIYSLALATRKEVEAYLGRAAARFWQKRYDEMIDDCTAALQLEPGNAAALDFQGDAHAGKARKHTDAELTEWKQAIEHYDASIRMDPDFAPTYLSRGVARASIALGLRDKKKNDQAKSEYQMAITDFCQAINLSPLPRSRYFENRARAYKQLANYDRAADDYTAALQTGEPLPADDVFALYYNRGFVYLLSKDFKRAEADFAKASSLNPDDPDPHKWRARALEQLGRQQDADQEKARETELRKQNPASPK